MDAVETMAYSGEVPWHGLGKTVSPNLTPDEMLKEAGLDWEVRKVPLVLSNDPKTSVDGYYALQRANDKHVLGICGAKYEISQNAQVFKFFDKFVKAGKMTMETAGSLHEGKHIWGLAKIKESFSVGKSGKDVVESFLLLSHPHIWGKSLQVMFTPIRVVCHNTLTMAMRNNQGSFRMPHIQVFDEMVMKSADEALGISHTLFGEFKVQAQFLASKEFTDDQLNRFIASLFEPKLLEEFAKKEKIPFERFGRNGWAVREAVAKQPGHNFDTKNTWWAALNAVTYCVDHEFGNIQDNRLEQAWFGKKAELKRQALATATEFAKAA